MDYRMYTGPIPANKNVVNLIKTALKEQNIKVDYPLKMVAFEGSAGTSFKLNGHDEVTKIPNSGCFYTPYGSNTYMPIYSLIFDEEFSGDIYYIV